MKERDTDLQYFLSMHLSQLEKESLTVPGLSTRGKSMTSVGAMGISIRTNGGSNENVKQRFQQYVRYGDSNDSVDQRESSLYYLFFIILGKERSKVRTTQRGAAWRPGNWSVELD